MVLAGLANFLFLIITLLLAGCKAWHGVHSMCTVASQLKRHALRNEPVVRKVYTAYNALDVIVVEILLYRCKRPLSSFLRRPPWRFP